MAAFTGIDLLILADIYPAREKPVPGVTGEVLLGPVRQSDTAVEYIAHLSDIVPHLEQIIRDGDVVITMGAGDVWKVGEQLLQRLSTQEKGELP